MFRKLNTEDGTISQPKEVLRGQVQRRRGPGEEFYARDTPGKLGRTTKRSLDTEREFKACQNPSVGSVAERKKAMIL